MKERNEIDRLLKDKLGEKAIAFNESHWAAMEKMLNRRRRRGVFFIFTIALLLTGFAGFALLNNSDNTQFSATRIKEHHVKVETREAQSILTNDFVSDKESDEPFVSETNQQNDGGNESTVRSTSALAKKNKNQGATDNADKEGSAEPMPEIGVASKKEPENVQSKQTEIHRGGEAIGWVNTKGQEKGQMVEDLEDLEKLGPIASQLRIDARNLATTKDSMPPTSKPFRFELIGFGAFGKQQIAQTQTTENALELANYEKGASSNYGIMFQARYNGWLAASGFDVMRISETADYGSYNSTIEELVEVTILDSLFIGQEFIVDSIFIENIQIWQVDTIFFDVYEYFEQTYVDTLVSTEKKPRKEEAPFSQVVSQVEVPLLFGKAFHFGKFELNILGGAAIAITTKVEGYVIEGSRLLERRTLSKDVTLNLHLRAGLSYALNDRWAFQVHTGYRRNATSILKFQGLEQRYSGIGFGGGLVYRFGGR